MAAHPTAVQFARKIWGDLVILAQRHATITYQELGAKYGVSGRALPKFQQNIDPIKHYCEHYGLPPLDALIVRPKSKKAGSDTDANHDAIQAVYAFDWLGRRPLVPNEDELAAVFVENASPAKTTASTPLPQTPSVKETGAAPGDLLRGLDEQNQGLVIQITTYQQPGDGGRVVGPFAVVEAGSGYYASKLKAFEGQSFGNAAELIDELIENEDVSTVHIFNCNSLTRQTKS